MHQAFGTDLPKQFKDVNVDLNKVNNLLEQSQNEAT